MATVGFKGLMLSVLCLFLQCKRDGVMSSADWKLDAEELASKFNSRTKIILLNNPNNPLGKVQLMPAL